MDVAEKNGLAGYTAEMLRTVNEIIAEHNYDRPDDRIARVSTLSDPRYIGRVIRYLGIEL